MSTFVDSWTPTPEDVARVGASVREAVKQRLQCEVPEAVLGLVAHEDRIEVVVNSGGNYLASARRLHTEGWNCQQAETQPTYGCSFDVSPLTAPPEVRDGR
jgi:hypothetical protein